jgi:predicted nucleic acid-binding protein
MPDPVYFDSSVFLAIFMGSDPSIKALLKELRRDKIRIYTSIVTVQEVSVQTFRRGFPAADNYAKVNKTFAHPRNHQRNSAYCGEARSSDN